MYSQTKIYYTEKIHSKISKGGKKMKWIEFEMRLKLPEVFSQWSHTAAAAAAKSLQSCPTLCDPIDGSTPGFPVPGILQARTLEWVAISFSNA